MVKLHRAWAINQGLFSTFALTTSLKISEGTDVARRKRKRREVRFNASILVQSYVRAMVARKKNKKWMTFMRRKNRIDGLVWGRWVVGRGWSWLVVVEQLGSLFFSLVWFSVWFFVWFFYCSFKFSFPGIIISAWYLDRDCHLQSKISVAVPGGCGVGSEILARSGGSARKLRHCDAVGETKRTSGNQCPYHSIRLDAMRYCHHPPIQRCRAGCPSKQHHLCWVFSSLSPLLQ